MAGLQVDTVAELAATHEVAYHEVEIKKQQPEVDYSSSEKSGVIDEHELDGIHSGLVFPTEEEKATLRRISDKVPWTAFLIAIVEMAERFSYYDSTVVFVNFIQQPLPPGSRTGAGGTEYRSGALGQNQRTSTGLNTFYQFWAYMCPLLGGYVADTKLGRFNTIYVGIAIAFLGHIILIISAIPGVIEKTGAAMGIFVIGMIITGLGTGFFKANISPLIAEQYKRTKLFVVTTESGERVIVDPAQTVSRIYMYFYLFTNIGSLVGQICMVYAENYVGFWLSFTLPTIVFLICPAVLFFGRKRYVRSPPNGSVLASSMLLWRFAAKGKWSINPVATFKNMTSDAFWEDVKPSRQAQRPQWMTFDDQWVDEVRRGLKACSVFLWYPIYWLTYGQINHNLISQAATMETHGLPNDILTNLNPLSLIILIPLCDYVIYPALRRRGIRWTSLKKITGGFFSGAAAMAWAAVVQHYIYQTSPCGYRANECANNPSPLNVWIQTGSYVLIALSEILASITGLEYAFTKAPKNMRSLVMSIFLFTNAVGAALSQAFLPLVEDPLLTWNYGSVGIIATVVGTTFWLSFRKLDAQEDVLNELPEGEFHSGTTNEKISDRA
ncbi:oligopeptide transporter [Moniliophthora roreri MCA 2997]|uniref:Oligopeptide transporter n=2 Tax=Moniliophthora roreri TaxID=221103 RepID=V2XK21_MONRO|nr:oligopeptide transporter [Moniliophthora roreri MCA 2997]KAI3607819.1 oligopeptide transporter [Moniliophthora roreri]